MGHKKIILNFAAACIVNNEGEILLQKRADFKDAWGFPGGALELGESAEEALKREAREETGLEIKIDKLIGVYTKYFSVYPNGDEAQTVLIFFRCTPQAGHLTSQKHETLELKYFKSDDMPPLFNKQHQDALADFLSGRSGVFR